MKNGTIHPRIRIFLVFCLIVGLSSTIWAQDVNFVSTPTSVSVSQNDFFSVVIQVQINSSTIDGAEAHLNFDPTLLQVIGVNRLSTAQLPTEILGPASFNNTNGTIQYVAGVLTGGNPTTSFDFIKIDFEAIAEGNTSIGYNFAFPRPTKMTSNFVNILGSATDIPVDIAAANIALSAKSINSMKISPNPAQDFVTASFKAPVTIERFYIFDVTGRLIETIEGDSAVDVESIFLGVNLLQAGTYFIKTIDQSGKQYQRQMVIKK